MPLTNGLVVMTPTSIVSTGTGNSSSINSDGSVTFSSCATLSLNGVFTSSYDNYMIVVRFPDSTTNSAIQIRLRVGGVDNSTASSYVVQRLVASGTAVASARFTQATYEFGAAAGVSTRPSAYSIYCYGPFLTQPTAFRSVSIYGDGDSTISDWACTHNQSTSYDGITIYPGAGNVGGLVTVFGFNQ